MHWLECWSSWTNRAHADISVAKSLIVSSSLYLYWEGQMIVLASIPNKNKKSYNSFSEKGIMEILKQKIRVL